MRTPIITLFLLGLSSSFLFAEESWDVTEVESGKFKVIYVKDNTQKLPFYSYYLNHSTLPKEVAEHFSKAYPDLWSSAIKSSGNIYNPKVIPLRSKFSEVLLQTPSIQRMEKSIRKAGYTITDATHEKLSIEKSGSVYEVKAIVWLNLNRLAEQDAAPNPLTVE